MMLFMARQGYICGSPIVMKVLSRMLGANAGELGAYFWMVCQRCLSQVSLANSNAEGRRQASRRLHLGEMEVSEVSSIFLSSANFRTLENANHVKRMMSIMDEPFNEV